MQSYKLKLTALTPIHIGTGEDYEPTNYVIDNGWLYEFDEVKFFKKLDKNGQRNFLNAVESNTSDSLFEIHRVIKNNKKEAIDSYLLKVQISKGLQEDYKDKVGRVVQVEGGKNIQKTKVFNRFQIARTARLRNTSHVYIPGSSIKGAISTAYQESIFKENYLEYKKLFIDSNPQDNILKNIMISDTLSIKTFALSTSNKLNHIKIDIVRLAIVRANFVNVFQQIIPAEIS